MGKIMEDSSKYEDGFTDDSSWEYLFEMAKNFEEQEDLTVYENIDFYESINFYESPAVEEKYHTPEEALKVLFGYDAFRPSQKNVSDKPDKVHIKLFMWHRNDLLPMAFWILQEMFRYPWLR